MPDVGVARLRRGRGAVRKGRLPLRSAIDEAPSDGWAVIWRGRGAGFLLRGAGAGASWRGTGTSKAGSSIGSCVRVNVG